MYSEDEGSASDSSLDKFCRRFSALNTGQQTDPGPRTSATQTTIRVIRDVKREKKIRRGRPRDAISVMTPTVASRARANQADVYKNQVRSVWH